MQARRRNGVGRRVGGWAWEEVPYEIGDSIVILDMCYIVCDLGQCGLILAWLLDSLIACGSWCVVRGVVHGSHHVFARRIGNKGGCPIVANSRAGEPYCRRQ